MTDTPVVARIVQELDRRSRFLLTSHARPDGDSIGSQLALAHALWRRGKTVRIINRDAPPRPFGVFPGIDRIEVAQQVTGAFDALVVMECSDLSRPDLTGLEAYYTINIDHHVGNAMYGDLNWFDESAAACGEMVYRLIGDMGGPITEEIATHLYLAILTDTGSFHHSNITSRTFEICRTLVDAGVDPARMARQVFDTGSVGRLKLMGTVLSAMTQTDDGRVAVLGWSDSLLEATHSTYHDTDGLVNLPLSAEGIEAVVCFKELQGRLSVSLRSKPGVDVRTVAVAYGGGGHLNAAGFTLDAAGPDLRRAIVARVAEAVRAATPQP